MAAPRQLLRPAQALARVLAQPSFQPVRFNLAAKLQIPVALPITQIRTAVRKPYMKDRDKDPRVQKSVVDEQIGSLYVNIVQDDGTFVPEQRLRDVLKDMDRISYFLVRVAKAEESHEHPYPVCRIIAKDELRNMEKEKNKKKKTWDDLTKVVEITWSVAKHDLENQMKRMTQFLEQGLRVEVALGPKKRGRTATPEEIEAVHQKVKETVASIPGIKEYAEAEGEVGRVLSLFYGKPKEKVVEEQEKQKEETAAAAAAAEAQKAEEDASKKPKKVSRYKIKEEEKRRQAVAEGLQARNRERRAALEDPGYRHRGMPRHESAYRQESNYRQESAYEREQRRMREERQRDAASTQAPTTQVRRRQTQNLGGRTGSFLTNLQADRFTR